MTANAPVVIDDIHDAIERLSPLGRDVVPPAANRVRDAVLLFAATRGWHVVAHEAFVGWLRAQLDPEYVWLVLDPLIDAGSFGVEAHPLRLSRTIEDGRWVMNAVLSERVRAIVSGREVGIIDDVVSSGLTLRHLVGLIDRAGGSVTDVAVCTSTAAGRDSVRALTPDASWVQFVSGDHDAIHLRDGCPLVAFGGRKMARGVTIVTLARPVEAVYPPTAFPGLWAEVGRDRFAASRIGAARKLLVDRLATTLGRPATVDDVPLVGDAVGYPHYRQISVTAETRIAELIG